MDVAAILRSKGSDVVTIQPGRSMAEAVGLFGQHGVGALVVSSDSQTVEGLVSERDIVRFVSRPSSIDFGRTVREIAETSPPVCAPEDGIEEVMAVMTNQRFRHLPVVDEGRLGGIVSIGDIVKCRLTELEATNQQLETYITGVPR